MKAQDVRAMTADQLDEQVAKLKKEQFNLRFQRATGQLENTVARARGAPRRCPHQDRRRTSGAAARAKSKA